MRSIIIEHLVNIGYKVFADRIEIDVDNKKFIRELHRSARESELRKMQSWIKNCLPIYLEYFADGAEIDPHKVEPYILCVSNKHEEGLFKMARLLWSLPYTRGFGRRMKFLVLDNHNRKLIGIIGIQSPPLDFPPRDKMFSYKEGCKTYLVNKTVDIYTLGAVPPYNMLIGGKLLALLAASKELRELYMNKYNDDLVAMTTTSAFGRSSLYNRLKYKDILIAEPIGYTVGYGTFHLDAIYDKAVEIAIQLGVPIANGFRAGPKPKWSNWVRILNGVGLPSQYLKHNISREAFLIRHIENLENYFSGLDTTPKYRHLYFQELVSWWKNRWMLPRSTRQTEWQKWKKEKIINQLILNQN